MARSASTAQALPVRIAAGCLVYNNSDIIHATVANLVAQGVTDVYIVDHASDEPVLAELERAFGDRARLVLIRKDSRAFHQGAMTTLLMRLALHDGADVFLPVDADEFPDCDDPASDLVTELSRWLRTEDTELLRIPLVNYLQFRDVASFDPARLGEIAYRVLPGGRPGTPERAATGRRQYLERAAVIKNAIRLTGLRDPDSVRLGDGSHRVYRGLTPLEELTASAAPCLVIRHLPERSQASRADREKHIERFRLMGKRADNRSVTLSDGRLVDPDEWERTSVPRSGPDAEMIARLRIVHDTAFATIAERIARAGLLRADPVGDHSSPRPHTSDREGLTADDVYTVAADMLGRQIALMKTQSAAAGQVLIGPGNALDDGLPTQHSSVAEQRVAEQRVAEMEASTSWRITAPLRFVRSRARQLRVRARQVPTAGPSGELDESGI